MKTLPLNTWMPKLSDIGPTVKRLRIARGYSLRQFAELTALGLRTITQIEQGEALDPHISTLAIIAKGLGVSVGELGIDTPCKITVSGPH